MGSVLLAAKRIRALQNDTYLILQHFFMSDIISRRHTASHLFGYNPDNNSLFSSFLHLFLLTAPFPMRQSRESIVNTFTPCPENNWTKKSIRPEVFLSKNPMQANVVRLGAYCYKTCKFNHFFDRNCHEGHIDIDIYIDIRSK